MEAVMQGARRVARWSLWFGGALVLLAAVLIGIDVVMRKLFATSVGGADELAGYALALGTAWALAAALVERAHIRIDSLYVLLPRRLRFVLDIAGVALLVAFFGLVAWHGWSMVAQSWASQSRSQSALQTPIVIPQFIWLLGLMVFVATGILLLVYAVQFAAHGQHGVVAKAISTRSAEEEVEGEIRDLEQRGARKSDR
jgi:TRAP-type C4-dicarboxylate transport system permease small subunit